MAEEGTKVFHYGQSVIVAGGDRHFEGVVVAAFRDRSSGKWRYVVEGDRGVQQTFSSTQLLRRGILLALVRSFGIARAAACVPPPFLDHPSSAIKEVVR